MRQAPRVPLSPLSRCPPARVSDSPSLLTSSEEDALASVDAGKAHDVQVGQPDLVRLGQRQQLLEVPDLSVDLVAARLGGALGGAVHGWRLRRSRSGSEHLRSRPDGRQLPPPCFPVSCSGSLSSPLLSWAPLGCAAPFACLLPPYIAPARRGEGSL